VRPFTWDSDGAPLAWQPVMLRVALLAVALTSPFSWPAHATDVAWLCYTGPQAPRGSTTSCWPVGTADERAAVGGPLRGSRGARTREAPRVVDVASRLGRIRIRLKGHARLLLAPADGGVKALACRPARARGRARTRTRLVLTDAHGEHLVTVGRPKRLCEPTDASLPELLCYRVTTRGARLGDAPAVSTGVRRAQPGRPEALCVPTLRVDSPPTDPVAPPGTPPPDPRDPGDPTLPPDGPGAVRRAPLSTAGARIVDRSGNEFVIQGVNWFGFETANHVPHGLWTRDYRDMLAQIASLGFNTIRLPFSIQGVRAQSFTGVDFSAGHNAALVGKTPLEAMDVIVEEAERQGLLVLLDNHSASDDTFTYGLWYGIDGYTEEDWVETWRMLATRYRDRRNVIGADLKNEPHGPATWGTGGPTDWRRAAERAGDAVHTIAPQWLIVVEGIEGPVEGQLLDRHWWGGNLEGVRRYPVHLDRPDKLVYSPHEYGPSVFAQPWFGAPNFQELLSDRWAKGFQFIADEGTAPILIGEFGGKETGTDTVAGVWLRQFMDYLGARGFSWTYWSWNPNSGDTGGVLLDDWVTVDGGKMALLRKLIAREPID
jgi:aryl-phospho-beta-D-glucosidase BglC (GH1 family)